MGGRGEEEGHPEWRDSDTCGPTGVGSWPLRRGRPGRAGAAEPSLQARPQQRHSLGLLTQGSSRQPLGAWSLHQFQGLHDGWKEGKCEFMPSANSCQVLSPGPGILSVLVLGIIFKFVFIVEIMVGVCFPPLPFST